MQSKPANIPAVIYARYSSLNQREESIEGQLRVCYEYAARNNLDVIGTYEDRALSGTSDKRPGFLRMIADSAKKTFKVVLVYKGDRLARNRYDKANYKQKLKKNGVSIVSATETIPDGPEGILLESLLDGLAEYYSANLAQNTLRGLTENALKAKHNGSFVPFGFALNEDNCYIIDPETAPIVAEIFRKYASGAKMKDIISWLKKRRIKNRGKDFNHNTLRWLLTNIKYTGLYKYADVEIPDGCPRLVSDEVFYMVQDKLNKSKDKKSSTSPINFLLSGSCFCGECGSTIAGDSGKGRAGQTYYYYSCHGKKNLKNGCDLPSFRKNDLEDFVVNVATTILNDPEVPPAIAKALMRYIEEDPQTKIIEALNKELKEVSRQIENLVKAISNGLESEAVTAKIKELEKEEKELKREIILTRGEKGLLKPEHIIFWLKKFQNGDVKSESFCELFVETMLNSVIIHKDKIALVFNYTDEKRKKVTFINENDLIPLDLELECSSQVDLAPQVGLEPTTLRLTAECSTD